MSIERKHFIFISYRQAKKKLKKLFDIQIKIRRQYKAKHFIIGERLLFPQLQKYLHLWLQSVEDFTYLLLKCIRDAHTTHTHTHTQFMFNTNTRQ